LSPNFSDGFQKFRHLSKISLIFSSSGPLCPTALLAFGDALPFVPGSPGTLPDPALTELGGGLKLIADGTQDF
jgi:hypothetical protein